MDRGRARIEDLAAAMQPEQDLHQAVGNQFVQGPEFLVGVENFFRVFRSGAPLREGGAARAGSERFCGLFNNGIFERLAGDLPQGDEAIHG